MDRHDPAPATRDANVELGRAWRENRMPSAIARPLFHDWRRYRETLAGLHDLGSRSPALHILPSHCGEAWADFQHARDTGEASGARPS